MSDRDLHTLAYIHIFIHESLSKSTLGTQVNYLSTYLPNVGRLKPPPLVGAGVVRGVGLCASVRKNGDYFSYIL